MLIGSSFPITDFLYVKAQLLAWASRYSSCCFLDNNQYDSDFHTYECLVAAGVVSSISCQAGEGSLQQLQEFINQHPQQWFFGHVGYDIKNETEDLFSANPDKVGFADLGFFVPQIVVRLQASEIRIESQVQQPEAVWQQIQATEIVQEQATPVILEPSISYENYIETIRQLQSHILRGDCYEINFCQPFMAERANIHPVAVFQEFCRIAPMPFSCFYRQQQQYLLCTSPERFLQKKGNHIFSQPMKGTAPRNADMLKDAKEAQALQASQKERSENVMVVDLVRNDLSRICKEGTVQANDLFDIQTYPQVHQMVSTISGVLQDSITFTDIIRATFPMGSMTGAPKKRVMELIEEYEPCKRGLFSGSVGYISPDGNFDFNVVIRSLLYNADTQHLQYFAGSAITFYSDPQQEYEECLLKTKAVRQVLENGFY